MSKDKVIFSLSREDTAILKGIAIIAMLCHHLNAPGGGIHVQDISTFWKWVGLLGKICVAIFVFCSGYGLGVQYSKVPVGGTIRERIAGSAKFLLRRFLKFYANYWVIFLLFVPITVLLFGRSLHAAYGESASIPWHLFLDVLGLQGSHSYNVTWWFNKLIILLYLLFPFIHWGVRKHAGITLLLAFVACLFCWNWAWSEYSEHVLLYVFPFTLGVAWTRIQDRMTDFAGRFLQHGWLLACVSAVAICACVYLREHQILSLLTGVKMDGIITAFIVLLVIGLRPYTALIRPVFQVFGRHSSNIYLLHTFINAYWPTAPWLHGHFSGAVKLLLLFVACLLCSIVIEWLKKVSRYDNLIKSVAAKV